MVQRRVSAFVVGGTLAAIATGALGGTALAEADKVRFAQQFGLLYLPMHVVVDKELVETCAKDAGLGDVKVTMHRFSGGAAVNQALLSGNVDFAAGGIGPNESVVAFSLLCTHKGCPLNFKSERNMLICPCHCSSFDPAKAGRLVIGQASDPLPQITLRITDGIVQAVGVSGLIYGRHTNII